MHRISPSWILRSNLPRKEGRLQIHQRTECAETFDCSSDAQDGSKPACCWLVAGQNSLKDPHCSPYLKWALAPSNRGLGPIGFFAHLHVCLRVILVTPIFMTLLCYRSRRPGLIRTHRLFHWLPELLLWLPKYARIGPWNGTSTRYGRRQVWWPLAMSESLYQNWTTSLSNGRNDQSVLDP